MLSHISWMCHKWICLQLLTCFHNVFYIVYQFLVPSAVNKWVHFSIPALRFKKGFSLPCLLLALSKVLGVACGCRWPWQVESSWSSDWTHVSCIGRQILNHWTTREVLSYMSWFPSTYQALGISGGSDNKESACNAEDPGSIPGSGRSPGEGNDSPLQYSCLENPMDRGAWRASVHGVPKSRTLLSDYHIHTYTRT